MIWILVGIFGVTVLGMLGIVLRHIREVFQLKSPSSLPTAGERKALEHVSKHVQAVESYGKQTLRPLFFSSLSNTLKWSEDKLISLVRSARKYQRELSQHARVSPKESKYWKDLADWQSAPNENMKSPDEQKEDDTGTKPEVTPTSVVMEDDVVIVAPEVLNMNVVTKQKTRATRSTVIPAVLDDVSVVPASASKRKRRISVKKVVRGRPKNTVDVVDASADNASEIA